MTFRRPTTLPIDEQLSNMFNQAFITETDMQTTASSSSYPSFPSPSPMLPTIGTIHESASLSITSVSTRNNEDDSESSTIIEEYQPRTLGEHNIARLSVLAIFPYFSLSPASSSSSMETSPRTPHLLLSNVPIELLTKEQYARIRYDAFPRSFQLDMDVGTRINPENTAITSCESFLLYFYQTLYVKMKKRLKVDITVIDFNLIRLQSCIGKVIVQRSLQQTMLNLDELTVALEFFLQFDIDMFFLKTCSFNGVQPRVFEDRFREGLFCIDTPEARFAITPCNEKHCLCCHSPCPRRYAIEPEQILAIPFSNPHIHRFVNQYEAILNCPATCTTNNCIYVLTCPCGQFDFVGESQGSFAETLAFHREEGNRIIREFLIGELNIQYITCGLHSDQKKANDKKWLYQHSPRCSDALQLFLDYNPNYWCFVPMKLLEVNMANSIVRRSSSSPSTSARSSVSPISWNRTDELVHWLVQNVPKPPMGFDFSIDQRQQQAHFFQQLKDRHVPLDNVDVYNADIVAVLPNKSSELFRQLIESLFITHAECKLNEIGHLVYDVSDPNRTLDGFWCANLTRRP